MHNIYILVAGYQVKYSVQCDGLRWLEGNAWTSCCPFSSRRWDICIRSSYLLIDRFLYLPDVSSRTNRSILQFLGELHCHGIRYFVTKLWRMTTKIPVIPKWPSWNEKEIGITIPGRQRAKRDTWRIHDPITITRVKYGEWRMPLGQTKILLAL